MNHLVKMLLTSNNNLLSDSNAAVIGIECGATIAHNLYCKWGYVALGRTMWNSGGYTWVEIIAICAWHER